MNTKMHYGIHKKDLLRKHQEQQKKQRQLQTSAFNEAKRLATILIEEFDVQAVYAFGPLTYGKFNEGMSLELAVEGMTPDRFASALGYLKQLSAFGTELVEVDAADSWTRQAILRKGVLLARKSV